MNSKQRKTLAAIFSDAQKTNIKWADIVSLLKALGVEVGKGQGSRYNFTKGEDGLHGHRPHPGKEVKPYFVRAVRDFLNNLGVTPESFECPGQNGGLN